MNDANIEIEKLRNAVISMPRERAIFEMLLSTGCRVSEIVGVKISDINGSKVIVIGKGNKERPVYLNASAMFAIEEYLKTRADDSDILFVSKRYNSDKLLEPLQKGSIEAFFRKIGHELGIENCHPHRFRRTMATKALRNGMPIEQVSRLLGHEQLTTTQIYARSEDTDVEAAHRRYVR